MADLVAPMKATLSLKPFSSPDWIFEIKWDGCRAIAEKQGPTVRLYSRNGLDFTKNFPKITNAIKDIPKNVILDGELVALDERGHSSFEALHNSTSKNIYYYVFDLLKINGRDLKSEPWSKRRLLLETIPLNDPLRLSAFIDKEGKQFFEKAKELDLEGIMAKKKDSKYLAGKRSKDWLKLKILNEQEAIIVGYTKGARSGFGALLLAVNDHNKLKYIGKVGTGFDERLIAEITKTLIKIEQANPPVFNVPKIKNVRWVKPKLVAEVKFREWTKDDKLRQPVFLGLREDKEPSEVIKESPMPKTQENVFGETGKEVTIVNPDKVFWPKENIKKIDVARYYDEMSEYILPYLKDRPESLYRTPNGITKRGFFQKNLENLLPAWFSRAKIYSKSNQKEITYGICNDKSSLLYMANLGCIEINPWSSRIKNLERPDYIIWDLDPVNIDFSEVRMVALAFHDILEALKIPHFCKTSGATGIHIYTPLNGKANYEKSKQFAKLIAIEVNKRLPEITSLERFEQKRIGKVYLDYLQNNEGQTLAAPYSVRPRPGAPVSTPLLWSELTKSFFPTDFNIKNIKKRVQRIGDIFKPVLGPGIDIDRFFDDLNKNSKFRA